MPKERFGYTKNTDTKRNTNNRKLKQSQQCKEDGKFHKCPYCGSGKGTTLCWAESKNDIDCYYYYYQQNYSWKEFLNCKRRRAPMFLQSEYRALSDGAKPYIQKSHEQRKPFAGACGKWSVVFESTLDHNIWSFLCANISRVLRKPRPFLHLLFLSPLSTV